MWTDRNVIGDKAIESIASASPKLLSTFQDCVTSNTPLVITNSIPEWFSDVSTWDLKALNEVLGETLVKNVFISTNGRFKYFTDSKDTPPPPHLRRVKMSFLEFITRTQQSAEPVDETQENNSVTGVESTHDSRQTESKTTDISCNSASLAPSAASGRTGHGSYPPLLGPEEKLYLYGETLPQVNDNS